MMGLMQVKSIHSFFFFFKIHFNHKKIYIIIKAENKLYAQSRPPTCLLYARC